MPRKLGQHFLHRRDVLEKIARAACPERESLVIEIGAGKGALTERLLERSDRVIAIELDRVLAEFLHRRFEATTAIEVVQADVLELDLDQWGPAVIAGNIPYYITSKILERVLAVLPRMKRAVLLVQREVAERITAPARRREYGLISVHTQAIAQPEILFRVPPSAFSPPPEVSSALVRLTPRDTPLLEPERLPAFLEFAARCFRYKRRTLRNNLAAWYRVARLDSLPEAALRAEQLSPSELLSLYEKLNPTA